VQSPCLGDSRPGLSRSPGVTGRRASELRTAGVEIHPTGVNCWPIRYPAVQCAS
jgi:hypothetical protein